MKTLSQKELIQEIDKVRGATIVSVDVTTTPEMRKTDNPYTEVTKTVTLSGMIGFDYENSVNLQLQREGKEPAFQAQPRKWGTYSGNWVVHKDKHYLPIKVQGSSDPVYRHKGSVIDETTIEPWLPKSSSPKTQEDLDKKIVVRDVTINNIKAIRMNGESYLIV